MWRRKSGREVNNGESEIARRQSWAQVASVEDQGRRRNTCAQKRIRKMIATAADVAWSGGLWSRRHGFMTSSVAMRPILYGGERLNARGTGGLQREACYRRKCGNSRHRANHRTKTHAQLSHPCLESRFYCMQRVAARGSSSIFGFWNVYCGR